MAQLSPGDMVAPKAIAPYEVALAFKLWAESMAAEALTQGTTLKQAAAEGDLIVTLDCCNGLGPPWQLLDERPTEYGERVAAALFTLIKEI